MNLKSSDEIIIPDMTYVATASAVVNNRCKLRIADVNLENASIKQDEVIRKINKNTKAIIIVNLWGFTASYKKLKKYANKKCFLIEDAAQSIGSYNSDGIIVETLVTLLALVFSRKKFGRLWRWRRCRY